MNRIASILVLLAIFTCIDVSQAQENRTVKLQNGEEVMDISGEWDTKIENYGDWSQYGQYLTVTKVKQEGKSFVGIRMKATTWHSAGSESY
jgi:hypothetical protein